MPIAGDDSHGVARGAIHRPSVPSVTHDGLGKDPQRSDPPALAGSGRRLPTGRVRLIRPPHVTSARMRMGAPLRPPDTNRSVANADPRPNSTAVA